MIFTISSLDLHKPQLSYLVLRRRRVGFRPVVSRCSLSTLSYSAIISERSMAGREPPDLQKARAKFEVKSLSFWYGKSQALFEVSLTIPEMVVVALIGPSGCGKSTFLRTLNRMNDLIEDTRHTGDIVLDGEDVYGRQVNLVALRQRVGMVFQKSNPFPKS